MHASTRVLCVIHARLVCLHTARFMHKLCAAMLPHVSCAITHACARFLLLLVHLTSATNLSDMLGHFVGHLGSLVHNGKF